jgi:hypothetical protein
MLNHEFALLLERLDANRGADRTLFRFCRYSGHAQGGRRRLAGHSFPRSPRRAAPSEILMHVRLLDKENVRQQEPLGRLG